MTVVRIQVIKVYDVEIDAKPKDAIDESLRMQTTQIEEDGVLVNATTDFAEVV